MNLKIIFHGKCLRPITLRVGGVKKGPKNAYVIFEWSQLDTRRELFSVVLSSWAISQQVDLETGKINSELRNEETLLWYVLLILGPVWN